MSVKRQRSDKNKIDSHKIHQIDSIQNSIVISLLTKIHQRLNLNHMNNKTKLQITLKSEIID